jgi:uncharacterized membrane protein
MENEIKKAANTRFKAQGLLCYLSVLVLIPFLTIKQEERDEFIDCHIKQGAGLMFVELACMLISNFGFLFSMLSTIIGFASFILSIVGLVNVVQNKITKLQYVGEYFAKLRL